MSKALSPAASRLDKSPSFAYSVSEYPELASKATHTPARASNDYFEMNLTPHGIGSSARVRAGEAPRTPAAAQSAKAQYLQEQLSPKFNDPNGRFEGSYVNVNDRLYSFYGNGPSNINSSAKVSSGNKLQPSSDVKDIIRSEISKLQDVPPSETRLQRVVDIAQRD